MGLKSEDILSLASDYFLALLIYYIRFLRKDILCKTLQTCSYEQTACLRCFARMYNIITYLVKVRELTSAYIISR